MQVPVSLPGDVPAHTHPEAALHAAWVVSSEQANALQLFVPYVTWQPVTELQPVSPVLWSLTQLLMVDQLYPAAPLGVP